jgi:hypothetical protein
VQMGRRQRTVLSCHQINSLVHIRNLKVGYK